MAVRLLPPNGGVDTSNPVNWSHPLNRGRVLWLYGLPTNSGGGKWFDLCKRYDLSLVASQYQWSPVSGDTFGVSRSSGNNFGSVTVSVTGAYSVSFTTDGELANNLKIPLHVAGDYGGPFINGATRYYLSDSGNAAVSFADTVDDNTHRHIWVFANSGTTSVGYSYYRDGGLISSGTSSGTHAVPAVAKLVAGGGGVVGYHWLSRLWNIGLWNRALSADEIALDYDLSRRGYPGVLNRSRSATWFAGTGAAGGVSIPVFMNHYRQQGICA